MKEYYVIGLMSGTSLDGVDLAYCRFEWSGKWNYRLIQTATVPYQQEWKDRLQNLFHASAMEYARTHAAYGKYLGQLVAGFIKQNRITNIDFVASHGHTIFHQPSNGFTSQIGEGAALSAACGLPVVCDFRTSDVAHGGQGAPLVPIGDHHLFADYSFCLNLGGIANVSFVEDEMRLAFDICFCNILLNYYSEKAGKAYDINGEISASGNLNETLLNKLNAMPYFKRAIPKSLGREDVEAITVLIDNFQLPVNDVLRTIAEHIAMQIAAIVNPLAANSDKILFTGGGTFNDFLIERIKSHTELNVVIPDNQLINFKEALIFAFLGVLRMSKEPNCLQSVTGSSKDVIGGAVYEA